MADDNTDEVLRAIGQLEGKVEQMGHSMDRLRQDLNDRSAEATQRTRDAEDRLDALERAKARMIGAAGVVTTVAAALSTWFSGLLPR